MFDFFIPAGTIVVSETRGAVTLQGGAWITGAERQEDGGYLYEVDGTRYYTCAGVLEQVRRSEPEQDAMWRHRNGLVWMGA